LADVAVLLVEDEPTAREMVALVLRGHGARVWETSSVAQAMDVFRTQCPDIVVSDIGLPDADGYELVSQVREQCPTLPCIALTAYARDDEKHRALCAGFTRHISKPFTPDALVAAIAQLIAE
jgi:CheY-like chemotaxis protein